MKKLLLLLSGAVVVGCGASRPPNELLDARVAYQHASTSPGAPFVSSDMVEAQRALDRAEHSFKDDGDSVHTKSLAYIASRRAIAAEAKGSTFKASEDKRTAMLEFQAWKDQQAAATRQQLEQTKTALSTATREVDSERQARVAADQKAMDALSQIAGVQTKQSERGLVLSLSGSVLFASGKSDLLPAAKKSLTDVAKALKTDSRNFTIVGHTDSTGTEEANMLLSKARANSVRGFLVSQGIDSGKIRSEGAGQSQPIADNTTPEGRANNRRVEIILENNGKDTQGARQTTP
jgi:outer membrane protein OmpA-like peptidoglycan-associated protein